MASVMRSASSKMPKIGKTVKVTDWRKENEYTAKVIDIITSHKSFIAEITIDGFTDTFTVKLSEDNRETLEFSWDFEEVDCGQVEASIECSHAAEISPYFYEMPREIGIVEIRKVVKKFAKEHNLIFTETTLPDTGRSYAEAKLNAYHGK